MSWQDLIDNEIEILNKDLESEKKKLAKAVSEEQTNRIIQHSIKVDNIKFAIQRLYICLGKASGVVTN